MYKFIIKHGKIIEVTKLDTYTIISTIYAILNDKQQHVLLLNNLKIKIIINDAQKNSIVIGKKYLLRYCKSNYKCYYDLEFFNLL